MNITDEKLDTYISNIKNPDSTETEILLNYKKATKRIDGLKSKYNKISDKSKSKSDSDSNSNSDDMPLTELIAELDRIKSDLESNSDLTSILNLYIEYRKLIDILSSKHTELQNQFYKIDGSKADISISKINLEYFMNLIPINTNKLLYIGKYIKYSFWTKTIREILCIVN